MPRPPATEPTRPAAAPEAGDLNTRPDSLWPDSAHPLEAAQQQGVISSFDPERDGAAPAPRGPAFALCQPATSLRVLLFVQGVVALASLPLATGWRDALLRASGPACAALLASLLWLAAVCRLQPRLMRLRAAVASAAVWLLGALAALAGWALALALGVAEPGAWAATVTALAGAALAGVLWAWLRLRLALARPADARARLSELQSRIRPHFLFNALNTALALVQVDPARAEVVLEDLSALFRAALAETGTAVTLDDEIDLAQRYLAIEKLRFAERLDLRWDLDPDAAFARLPPLVLQPLVENAVRHGVEPAARGGKVLVRTRVHRGMAEVVVINTLPDEAEGTGEAGAGMALANVRERLHLMHDLAATLDTKIEDGRWHARIAVPL
ncbi:sensor histidine kinase [Aquabacterium sp. OR-4]|uniref:sensor histidine kinase n=1 Tax=Aquabacterium sp. OR-4 TaxID=2978127 RepID=UPI0028CAB62C|nr:histidine kinase [Aquabacterium sp. OR-4]MDT7835777.1 histidine kinase [Aquabacterium sp. OR-4]